MCKHLNLEKRQRLFKRSCGKVMILHLFLSHSVHGGGRLPQCMLGYTHPPRQTPPPWQTLPGQTPPWTDTPLWADTCHPGQIPPSGQTATAADDTHPTGMHSCLVLCSLFTFVFNANGCVI